MGTVEFTEIELDLGTVTQLNAPYIRAYDLADRISLKHGITVEELRGRRRFKHIVAARVEFCKSLRAKNWSYPAIALFLNRDHTSIMYLLKRDDVDYKNRKKLAHYKYQMSIK